MNTVLHLLILGVLGYLVWRIGVVPMPAPVQPEKPEPPALMTHQPTALFLTTKAGVVVAEKVIHSDQIPSEVRHNDKLYLKTGVHRRGVVYTEA